MKKVIIALSILCFVFSAKAQLNHTLWGASLNVPMPLNCTLKFNNDTLSILYAGVDVMSLRDPQGNMVQASGKDSIAVETMNIKFSTGNIFTVTKIIGGSPCDNTDVGKYAYTITANSMKLSAVSEACDARKEAFDGVEFKKL